MLVYRPLCPSLCVPGPASVWPMSAGVCLSACVVCLGACVLWTKYASSACTSSSLFSLLVCQHLHPHFSPLKHGSHCHVAHRGFSKKKNCPWHWFKMTRSGSNNKSRLLQQESRLLMQWRETELNYCGMKTRSLCVGLASGEVLRAVKWGWSTWLHRFAY